MTKTTIPLQEEAISESGVQTRASAPSNLKSGQKWIQTDNNTFNFYNGSSTQTLYLDNIRTVNSSGVLLATDGIVLIDASISGLNLSLPSPVAGKTLNLIRIDNSGNEVTINAQINNASSVSMDTQYQSIAIFGTGVKWIANGLSGIDLSGSFVSGSSYPIRMGETKAISGPRGVYLRNRKILRIVAGSNEIRFLEGATPYIATYAPGEYLFGDEAALKSFLDAGMNTAGGDTNYDWTVDQDNIDVANLSQAFTLDKTHPNDLLATLGFVSVPTGTPANNFTADQERDWDNEIFGFLTDTGAPETSSKFSGVLINATFNKFDTATTIVTGLIDGLTGLSLDDTVYINGTDGAFSNSGSIVAGKVRSSTSFVVDPHPKGFIFDYEPDTDTY